MPVRRSRSSIHDPSIDPWLGKELGLERMDIASLIGLLLSGLPWSSVTNFVQNSGFSPSEVAHFVRVPERTFARRRESGFLEPAESERLLRLADVFARALRLFDGDRDAARRWLTSPVKGLGNSKPIDYAQTELGASEVRNLMGRLEHGVFS